MILEPSTRQFVHEAAAMCRFFGWTWDYVLNLPQGLFAALSEEIMRLKAEEQRDMLLLIHTKDAKWLHDRLDALANYGTAGRVVTDEQAQSAWDRLQRDCEGAS